MTLLPMVGSRTATVAIGDVAHCLYREADLVAHEQAGEFVIE